MKDIGVIRASYRLARNNTNYGSKHTKTKLTGNYVHNFFHNRKEAYPVWFVHKQGFPAPLRANLFVCHPEEYSW